MRASRGLPVAVLLCLVGAFVVLVAAGRTWSEVATSSPLLGEGELAVTGIDLVPGVRALGLVGLAGVVALAATRGWGRVVVGVLLVLTGAGVVALVAGVLTDPLAAVQASGPARDAGGLSGGAVGTTPWPWACALGGTLLAGAGLLVAARGRSWAALGQRYEAPVGVEAPRPPGAAPATAPGPAGAPVQTPAQAERALWEALDRGEDPTAR